MKKIIPLAIILTLRAIPGGVPEETTGPAPPALPSGPVAPVGPVVPGAERTDGRAGFAPPPMPGLAPRPARPEGSGEGAAPGRIIESYGLAVGSVLAAGNARSNMAHTVTDARYTVYTNHTAALRLEFRNGPPYVYHLGLPSGRTEIRTGVYRETRGVTVQAGSEFLLENYTAEIYHDAGGIIQADIFGSGRIVVTLNVARKP